MYERQTYFRDTADADTKGIVIIETDESTDEHRVTDNRDGEWCKPYWIPVSQFSDLSPERVGTLSSDQFLGVCRACGVAQ